ncbi:PREDICTED: 39S ribosomal protein L10, mitochondrial, partial [Charadrius vociferus]|uniref:39S ribosomal protein L10, mitochondrial n=1 Tax=Charadrius vociferus TaxID=50402 RepID=UPI00052137C1
MHFQRQKLMAVTEYLAPRPAIPPRCVVPRREKAEEDNGYARLLRRQVEEVFRNNRMIAVCQYNSMPGEDVVLMRHYLRKHNIEVKFVLNEIVRPVLSQSKYKNLLPLFVARNILLVSPETKVKEMLRVLKGVPQVNLLGACIDNAILSRQGVENFAKLPSLEATQGQTVGALALLPSQTSSLLQRGSAHLTALLDQHIRQLQGSESWEVVEEPRARGSPGQEPQRHEGYLLKKRKWPLKGWHKRYFVLENGILKYATTRQDVLKGKLHGAIDIRQSVMSINKKAQR